MTNILKNYPGEKFIIIGTFLAFLFLISGCGKKQPQAPGEDVVATYSGKSFTRKDLRDYIARQGVKEQEHAICEKHGFDHSQCDKLEACESHPLHSIDAYRIMIKAIVLEDITGNWAKEKGITARKEVKHGLKHIVEEVNLGSLAAKMHEDKIAPDKIEIQQYFEEHRDEYKGRSLSEVEEEIKSILVSKKEKEFIPQYVEKLKENAAMSTNYDLLKIDEPSEMELRSYYESHILEYAEPEKIGILQIKIDICSTCSKKTQEDSRRKAEEAMAKLREGEDFKEVAKKYSAGIYSEGGSGAPAYIKKGDRGEIFEANVFNLGINEISPIFEDKNSFYIVKVIEKQGARQKPLAEVISEIKAKVVQQKEDEKYELNKTEAIFTMHGKGFTLGEFREEFNELSPQEKSQFASFEAKKNLVDQLIIKELLLEEVGDKMLDQENKQEVEDLKAEIIRQILHREEVDEKIEISDKEAKEIYEKRRNVFIEPAKAQISYIRISGGSSADEEKKNRQKIEEALKKIKEGAEFGSVAKEYSEDWSVASNGELDHWIYEGASHLGEMVEHDFHETIFKLEPGQTSEVFKFGQDFFIVKMRQKEEKKQQAFEEAKYHIKELLSVSKHQQRAFELQEELLKKANLIIYDSTLKQMLKEAKQRQKEISKERR